MNSKKLPTEKAVIREYDKVISEIVDRHKKIADFWSTEVLLPSSVTNRWICMRNNPNHFTLRMFLGSWSVPGKHPKSELIRLVRLMEMPDNTLRIIGRQGSDLYVLILD